MNLVRATELAKARGITPRGLRKQAATENWTVIRAKNPNGGHDVLEIDIDTVPEPIRLSWYSFEQRALLAAQPAQPPAVASAEPALCDAQRENALAKADLLRLYQEHLAKAPWKAKTRARDAFVAAYNAGFVSEKLLADLGPISWKSIERWKLTVRRTKDPLALAETRGYVHRGECTVTDEVGRILIRCALSPNNPPLAEVIRTARDVMKVKGVSNGHSDATYRRWLERWKSLNYDAWVFLRQGAKAWNDKVAYSIQRDYGAISVGDVLVADGHILNFEIINPWTGKPKRMTLILWFDMKSSFPCGWEIMPTENTQAIASALRRAILCLGKMPKVAYLDNGRAFGAKFFTQDIATCGFNGLFERLDVRTIFAWPYHAQSKPVERFFETFGELERRAPTYVGSSIQTQPPRLHRGEFLHRKVWEKIAGNHPVTLMEAHAAIAQWFDEWAARVHKTGHLAGTSSAAVFSEGRGPGVDAEALNFLMMKEEEGGHIGRLGVHHNGKDYYAPELYGRKHPCVKRFDLQDTSYILVYTMDGQFLCKATLPPKVHPAARVLGTQADQDLLAGEIALKRAQEREASTFCRRLLETEVIPEHLAQAERLGFAGVGADPRVRPELPEPAPEPPINPAALELELEELRLAQEQAAEAEQENKWRWIESSPDMDRYLATAQMQAEGKLIPKKHAEFIRFFEETADYKNNEAFFKAQIALMREAAGL